MQEVQLNEENVPSVFSIHKDKFTTKDWGKILLFERHFSLLHPDPIDQLDDAIHSRKQYLNTLKSLSELSTDLQSQLQSTIKRTIGGIDASNVNEKVEYFCKKSHLPTCLDLDLLNAFSEIFPDQVQSVFTVDHEQSSVTNSLDIFIEVALFGEPLQNRHPFNQHTCIYIRY